MTPDLQRRQQLADLSRYNDPNGSLLNIDEAFQPPAGNGSILLVNPPRTMNCSSPDGSLLQIENQTGLEAAASGAAAPSTGAAAVASAPSKKRSAPQAPSTSGAAQLQPSRIPLSAELMLQQLRLLRPVNKISAQEETGGASAASACPSVPQELRRSTRDRRVVQAQVLPSDQLAADRAAKKTKKRGSAQGVSAKVPSKKGKK